jgi:uncharacterized protein
VIVVSDSSPLIALSSVGQLTIVQRLYGKVLIPEAIYQEVVSDPAAARAGSREVAAAEWIEVRSVSNRPLVERISEEVDPGEAEAFALALELGADLVLVDDRGARAAAARLGLRTTGVGGILVSAKAEGLIPLVKPLLDEMIARFGFRMKSALYQAILNAADE